ncbi:hypothetical protein PSTG_20113 [Puccinia striiformis f. sp. tritici PST-78]|uniref:Uncharacterized protein n=1 Tax=Puccinia striiformis f. sp. tritici PST-78 TaxID=1165861 RepID=A0A0L0UHX3_9BASI|nr:hypothetical protein PSTG_20113 [Puccinia striiformis f. sp. tritici PST-78]
MHPDEALAWATLYSDENQAIRLQTKPPGTQRLHASLTSNFNVRHLNMIQMWTQLSLRNSRINMTPNCDMIQMPTQLLHRHFTTNFKTKLCHPTMFQHTNTITTKTVLLAHPYRL